MSTDLSHSELKMQLVKDSLISLIKKFGLNPANYFYEEELRADLFIELRNRFEKGLSVELMEDHWFKSYKSNKTLINPVRAEYGRDSEHFLKHNIKNIDIGILSTKLPSKEGNNYQRRCDVVIELKYSQDDFDSKHSEFVSDLEKIKKANRDDFFLGIVICFDLNNYKSESDKLKFFQDYSEKDKINFREANNTEDIEAKDIIFLPNECYAFYVTPQSVFVSS